MHAFPPIKLRGLSVKITRQSSAGQSPLRAMAEALATANI
jgi:hypothetical protein